jgi:hypothetical protein
MPGLRLSPTDHRALVTACAALPLCVATIEGDLAELHASPDEPTRMAFDDVEVLGTRGARPDESWVHSPVKGALATSKPAPAPAR